MKAPPVSQRIPPSARTAYVDAFVSAAASAITLVGGWLYPVYCLSHDPDLQRSPDPDFRAGVVIPIAIVLGFAFAARACWSFVRARRLR